MIKVALAGSTTNTTKLAQALLNDNEHDIQVSWVLTPTPKPLGRKKAMTKNPLHQWADVHNITTILIHQPKLSSIKTEILNQERPEILLVADFGYFLPQWLLELPTIAPVNIHPSRLPEWRGSSPGQFVILSGAKTSAVSFIIMNEKLDQGPIIQAFEFPVDQNWTSLDYYEHTFNLASKRVAQVLGLLEKEAATRRTKLTPQPLESPTPLARKLDKDDGFVYWDDLVALMSNVSHQTDKLPYLFLSLIDYFPEKTALAEYVVRASRALYPWPTLWTRVPTKKGQKRMKILEAAIETNKLVLKKVQLEGQQPALFNQIKNLIQD